MILVELVSYESIRTIFFKKEYITDFSDHDIVQKNK